MNKKINRKILLTTVLLIILTSNLITISNATVINENTSIFSNRTSKILINYKGKEMVTVFNTYRNNGILYEAYNVKYPTYSYNNASQKELISENEFVWQVLANGFPYKTIEELKCANYEEAYAATQIAIYCAYCGHSESDYSAIANNASSQNVYNAFKEILQNARKNTIQTDKNTVVKLIEVREFLREQEEKRK